MALLARWSAGIAAALVAGCYQPALRDCTVSCSATDDCATGQICGTDHMCAAAGVAGTCATHESDGGVDSSRDARPTGDAPGDTARAVDLHVKVDGRGIVTVDVLGTCDSDAPNHGDCHFMLLAGTAATLQAVDAHGFTFQMWSGACTGVAASCTTPGSTMPVDVHAKFIKD